MNYLNILQAKEVYRKGENVTQYLRDKFNETENTSEIIETAYDLQAGSYITELEVNREQAELYTYELGNILNSYLRSEDSLLDVGSGELTTLTLMLNHIEAKLSSVLAFDISWSRLRKGIDFFNEYDNESSIDVTTFVADMKEIPLHEKCIDILTSSHALEPNGKNLP